MNTVSAPTHRSPFARIIGAIAAFIGQCNAASARLASSQNTPARF
jgi:hypothetical protein